LLFFEIVISFESLVCYIW